MKLKFIILTAILLISFSNYAQDSIAIMVNKDATLFNDETPGSNGAGFLFVGITNSESVRRALIKFDFSNIPPNRTVQAASLRVEGSKGGVSDVEIHRLLADWGEGQTEGVGAGVGKPSPAQTDDATWESSFFPEVLWENPGGDYDSLVLAISDINEGQTTVWQSEALTKQVQSWIDGSEENHGFILIGENRIGSAIRFHSKESNGSAPVLTIQFESTDTCNVDGGTLAGESIRFCSLTDELRRIEGNSLQLNGAVGGDSSWVVTDEEGVVVVLGSDYVDLSFDPLFDGIYRIQHLRYQGALSGFEIGESIMGLEGCFSLSNSIDIQIDDSIESCDSELNCNGDSIVVEGILQNPSCFGRMDGFIELFVGGGTAPYQFDWSGEEEGMNQINDLAAGDYSVTVTDNKGCVDSLSLTLVNPDSIEISPTVQGVTCNGQEDGMIMVEVSGGTAPYTYNWSNEAEGDLLENLGAGTYTLTVTDQNECTQVREVMVAAPDSLKVEIVVEDITCGDEQDGMILAEALGGIAPYTYNWSNEAEGDLLENLGAGTYTLTVTDQNECTQVTEVIIEGPDSIGVEFTVEDITCGDEQNGMIIAEAFGGLGPYTYNWSNEAVGDTLENLAIGTYSLTITDQSECTHVAEAIISGADPILVELAVQDIECGSENLGAINALVSGGVPPYAYNWNNGGEDSTIQNLFPGLFALTITDQNECTAMAEVMLNGSSDLQIDFIANDVSCANGLDGRVGAEVTGGTGPYNFKWSTGAEVQFIENLVAGDYTVTVTDQDTCSQVSQITLTAPDPIQVALSIQGISCFGEQNGAIEAVVSGGIPPYLYQWNNGIDSSYADNLAAGFYILNITDQNLCNQLVQASLEEPDPIEVDFAIQDVACSDGTDGAIETAIRGGTTPYTVIWNDQDTSVNLVGILPGDHTIKVLDVNDCSFDTTIQVTGPMPLSLDFTITPGEDGLTTGSITATIEGGTAPYQFRWSDPELPQAAFIDSLALGEYQLFVSDANGCVISGTATVGIATSFQKEIVKEYFRLYPNPVSNLLQLDFENSSLTPIYYKVWDQTGKLLQGNTKLNQSRNIDVSWLPAGLYYLELLGAIHGKQSFQKY